MSKAEQAAPLQSNQATEEVVRNQAIDLFIAGCKPGAICQAVKRSREWWYRTLMRYRQGGREALRDRSRAPKRVHNRTAVEVENAIVRIRQTILSGEDAELRYASVGADTIALELKRAGIEPPARRTINRILQRRQLILPRRAGKVNSSLPEDYPWPCAEEANAIHLFDFVTRSITGGGRFYSCNLMDQKRRWPFLRIIVNKSAEAVAHFLVEAWQEIGLPTALQIDNDIVWRGSSSAKRTFSRIVRLALLVGVEIIFTPPYTPKANAIIESFNALWTENFWLRTTFENIPKVESELPYFEATARYRHPWPEFDGFTAAQLVPDFHPCLLAPDFVDHRQKRLPLTAGRLHFLRFVDADGSFSIFNETWSLPSATWAGKSIRATLDLQQQQLFVFQQPAHHLVPTLIAQFDYPIAEEIVPLHSCFQRTPAQLWLPQA